MDIESLLTAVQRLPPRAPVAREAARLRRDELDGSLAIARTALSREEVAALLDRGLALGGHALLDYLVARDAGAAAAWVGEQRPRGRDDPRPLLTIEEIRRIHALATAGRPEASPGAWRMRVAPPRGDVVSPPPWSVPAETAALVERVRRPPNGAALASWLAGFLARYARIRPFASGNGRAARLTASLLLRRIDAPPVAIARARSAAYRAAVLEAESGRADALVQLLSEALEQGCRRLIAAGGDDPLLPLRELAGNRYPALIKAARRGRLPTVVRSGRVYTTAGWIAEYGLRASEPR